MCTFDNIDVCLVIVVVSHLNLMYLGVVFKIMFIK